MKRVSFLDAGEILVVVMFVTLTVLQLDGFSNDPGVGWHLATGDLIRASGEIPTMDPFLASPAPRAWVSDQWGADLFFSHLFSLGGFPVIYGFLLLLHLAVYCGLYRFVRGLSGSGWASFLAVFFAFKLSLVHFVLRPVVFGIALLTLVIIVAVRLYRRIGDTGETRWGDALVLGGAFLLWANVHPSFIMGLVVIGLLPFAAAADGILLRRENYLGHTTFFFSLVVISVGATVGNPFGVELHRSIFALAQSEYFMSYHEEWLPMKGRSPESSIFKFVVGVLGIGLALGAARRWRWGTFDALMLTIFTSFALDAVRGVPFFGVVIAPYVAQSLLTIAAVLPESIRSRIGGEKEGAHLPDLPWWSHGMRSVTVLGLLVGGWVITSGKVPLYSGTIGPSPERFPAAAIDALRTMDKSSFVVFSPPHWGGYVTWRGRDGEPMQPIIDDRNTLLGEEMYRSFHQATDSTLQWREFIAPYHPKYVVWPKKSPFGRRLKELESSSIIYEDDVALILSLAR